MALSDLLHKPAPAELKAAGVTPVRTGIIAGVTDWAATRTDIEAKLLEAHGRREKLVADRDEILVPAVSGDTAAASQADKLDLEISAVDMYIDRAHKAAAKCDERLEAEAAAKEKADRAAHWRQVEELAAKREQLAARVDELGEQYAEAIASLASLGLEMHSLAPDRDTGSQHDTVLSVQAAEEAVRVSLKSHGVRWVMPHITTISNPSTVLDAVRKQHSIILDLKEPACPTKPQQSNR